MERPVTIIILMTTMAVQVSAYKSRGGIAQLLDSLATLYVEMVF